jgi:hypothetical protein
MIMSMSASSGTVPRSSEYRTNEQQTCMINDSLFSWQNLPMFHQLHRNRISNDCGVPPVNIPINANPTTSKPSLCQTSKPTSCVSKTGAPATSIQLASLTLSAAVTATQTATPNLGPMTKPVAVSTTVPSTASVTDTRW